MHTTALDPAIVAGRVVDAVRSESFWILTHDVTHVRARHRNEAQQRGETPTMIPFEGD